MKNPISRSLKLLMMLLAVMSLMPLSAMAEGVNDETVPKAEMELLEGGSGNTGISVDSSHSGDYWYDNVTGGVKIVSYSGGGGNVDVPAAIDGKSVVEIGTDVFNGNNALTGVNLPDSVTAIGMRAFYNCPNLDSVFLGNGLITLGNGAFWHCTALSNIIIPYSTTSIGYAAFNGCTGLKKITIKNSVTTIDAAVFDGIPNLTIYGPAGSAADSYAYAHLRPFVAIPTATVDCYYQTHIQNVGWQSARKNGAISGTTGQGLRLEGIKILVDNSEVNVSIQYQTHVQNIGWQGWFENGALSGTQGQSLRLEGIRIELDGTDAGNYDVYYRVHAQNFGWLDWAKNGESSGTSGLGLRLEGIQIIVVPKGSAAPGATLQPFVAG